MISFYHSGNSIFHRMRAGYKLLALVVIASLVFQVEGLLYILGAMGSVAVMYVIARIPFKVAFGQLRPALYLLVIIFVAQYFMLGWEEAALIVLRFATLILLAGLVTLTTQVSKMVAAIETALSLISRWIAVEKVSLAITLAIRFIPVLSSITHEVREAQKVRGMDRSIFAIAMPVVIRTLKMGNDVAEALDARSFGADPRDLHR